MERVSACLVIILAFHFLVPSNAIPLSRVQRLLPLQEAGEMPPVEESTPKPKMEITRSVISEDDAVINTRMVLETQDYPPSGPNNHHKPPGWS